MAKINPTHWKPGESGNPRGRPKGSRNKVKIGEAVEQCVAELVVTHKTGEAMLASAGPKIVASMVGLALFCEDPRLKFKALSACFDRLIPVLRVVDLRPEHRRRPYELSDRELISLGMKLQQGISGKAGGDNGGEPVLIEGTIQGDPGENHNQEEK